METEAILRGESNLPAALRPLLQAPPPGGVRPDDVWPNDVWHVPLAPRQPLWRMLWPFGRARRGDSRLGLWLTDDYILLADEKELRAVRCSDIVSLRVHRIGRSARDHLAIELAGARLRFPVDRLEGWAGRGEGLRAEVDRRQREWRNRRRAPEAPPEPSPESPPEPSPVPPARRDFRGLVDWLDLAMRKHADPASRAAVLELMARAMARWPDERRRAQPDWYLCDGRFAGAEASWLLPLSRTLVLPQAASLLPDGAAARAAVATFRNVPLTRIEIEGPLSDAAFDAVLVWAATKKLQHLVVSATPTQKKHLEQARRVRTQTCVPVSPSAAG